MTRLRSAIGRMTSRHKKLEVGQPWISSTAGPAPADRYAIRSGPTRDVTVIDSIGGL